jgi:hypothetical protein
MVRLLAVLVLAGASAFAETISLESGLRLRYEFNNNVLDTSGNNFDGTLNGNPSFTSDQNNNANSAIFLNGSAQFVRFPDTVFGPSVEAFTFYAKVNVDPSKSGGIVMKGSTNGEAQLKIFNGEFSFQVNTGTKWEYATTTATAGYKNLVGTYLKNSNISIFVDGDLKTQTPINNSGLWANWGFFSAVGAYTHAGGSFEYFDGVIDEVRIYDRALNTSEIQALGVPEPTSLSLLLAGGAVLMARRRKV